MGSGSNQRFAVCVLYQIGNLNSKNSNSEYGERACAVPQSVRRFPLSAPARLKTSQNLRTSIVLGRVAGLWRLWKGVSGNLSERSPASPTWLENPANFWLNGNTAPRRLFVQKLAAGPTMGPPWVSDQAVRDFESLFYTEDRVRPYTVIYPGISRRRSMPNLLPLRLGCAKPTDNSRVLC